MRTSFRWSAWSIACGLTCWLGAAAQVAAQTPAAPGGGAQPASPTPSASEPGTTPAPPEVSPEAAPPAVPPPEAPALVPPPAVPPPPPPPPPPEPVPQYGQLGGTPEQAIQEGEWNPWDHPETGSYAHYGFFMRLSIGPGGREIWRDGADWSGWGLGLGVAIGGAPIPNLALHVDFQGSWTFDPSYDIDSIAMRMLGLGATYYFPFDLFVSVSAGIGGLGFESSYSGQDKDTDPGFALDVMLGKEWWVGMDWGIGFAAQMLYIYADDYIDDKGINAFAFNFVFTATYN